MFHNYTMNKKICSILETLTQNQRGIISTKNEHVKLFRFDCDLPRQTFYYDACVVFLCQGRKIGFYQGQEIHYNPDSYLIMSAPLPLDTITIANQDEPLLGFFLDLDPLRLQAIWKKLDAATFEKGINRARQQSQIANVTQWSAPLTHLIEKLLSELLDDETTRILSDNTINEIYYHLMKGEQSPALFTLADKSNQFSRLVEILIYIQQHLAEPISIDHLVEKSGMSRTVFFRVFKEITDESPIQYIKRSRLSKAKMMIEDLGQKVGQASLAVGYESVSQFSREFKRLYGTAPSQITRN